MLGEIAQGLGILNSAKSLLGDGGSRSERESMTDQFFFNMQNALQGPLHQVQGLRAAGLNPMLAVTKGIPTPASASISPGSEDQARASRQQANTAATVASAQVMNLNASTAKQVAEAKLADAQAETERRRPDLISTQTGQASAETARIAAEEALSRARYGLTTQQTNTETFRAKVEELNHAFQAENYGNRVNLAKVELEKARAELLSARTKADVDKALLHYERILGMAEKASGAVSGLVPWARLFKGR